jgi:hypothetical protein
MLLLLLLSMLIGWLIGGPDRESRRVLATSTGMRSVIVVLYVVRYCFPGTNVYMIPIVYLSLMVPTNLLFHLAFTEWHKMWPAAEAQGYRVTDTSHKKACCRKIPISRNPYRISTAPEPQVDTLQ